MHLTALNCLVRSKWLVALLTVDIEGIASAVQAYHHYHPRSHRTDEGKVCAMCLMHFM